MMAIDPVCKMTVDEKKAAATSEYKGKKYYFCAAGCKKAFDQNPEKYLAPGKSKQGYRIQTRQKTKRNRLRN
jgi:YHS domain-containing protein